MSFHYLIVATLLGLFWFPSKISNQTESLPRSAHGCLKTPSELAQYCPEKKMRRFASETFKLVNLYTKPASDEDWIVFSDRSENALRKGPSKDEEVVKRIKFMRPMLVYKVKNNWLAIGDKSGFIGWIQSDRLLLSRYAIANDYGLPKKGMAIVKYENINDANEVQRTLGDYSFHETPDNTAPTIGTANRFQIYYILKKAKGFVLLSTHDRLSATKSEATKWTAGWINEINITPWDHRLCMEPENWSDQPLLKGDSIPVFANIRSLENYWQESADVTALYKYPTSYRHPNPYLMRMPILNHLVKGECEKMGVFRDCINFQGVYSGSPNLFPGQHYHVATMGSLKTQAELAETKQIFGGYDKQLKNANILFIIDATASMQSYYPAVANTISDIIDKREKEFSQDINLRFAFAIYRDYPDGGMAYEYQDFDDPINIIDKILNTKCWSNPADKDLFEAQYNGIEKAIKQAFTGKEKESNILVLIGDAGNHFNDPKGLKTRQISQVLASYYVNLIAFQVHYSVSNSYKKFNKDVIQYLIESARLRMKSNRVEVNLKENVSMKNTYDLVFKRNNIDYSNYMMFGRFTHASSQKAMSTAILRESIVKGADAYFRHLQSIDRIHDEIDPSSPRRRVNSYNGPIIDFISDRLGLSNEQKAILKGEISELSIEGYVSTNTPTGNHNTLCYKPVVYLSEGEGDIVDLNIKSLRGTLSTTESKKTLITALTTIVCNMMGDQSEEARQRVEAMSLNEIWKIILGVGFDEYFQYAEKELPSIYITPIKDLNNASVVTEDDFLRFVNMCSKQARHFDINDFPARKFEIGNRGFYWIPLELLPGFKEIIE